MAFVVETERTAAFRGCGGIESPAMRGVAGEAVFAIGGGKVAAGSRVERAFRAVRGIAGGADFFGHFAAGAKARVDHAELPQSGQGGRVGGQAVGLAQWFLVPGEAQPLQVVEDGGEILGPDAGVVDVLEAHEEAPATGAGEVVGDASGQRVAEVETPGRTGGETGDDHRRRRRIRSASDRIKADHARGILANREKNHPRIWVQQGGDVRFCKRMSALPCAYSFTSLQFLGFLILNESCFESRGMKWRLLTLLSHPNS